jgi:hypothetical protein
MWMRLGSVALSCRSRGVPQAAGRVGTTTRVTYLERSTDVRIDADRFMRNTPGTAGGLAIVVAAAARARPAAPRRGAASRCTGPSLSRLQHQAASLAVAVPALGCVNSSKVVLVEFVLQGTDADLSCVTQGRLALDRHK